ncbi:hypothetical protein CRENBAI_010624 [Crenichthys baileyi]|uniref:Uncharacterized protein n=1 Tax=Crenichthys baileyi TaxID=28760 RepID=A0AAV9S760_9TELE
MGRPPCSEGPEGLGPQGGGFEGAVIESPGFSSPALMYGGPRLLQPRRLGEPPWVLSDILGPDATFRLPGGTSEKTTSSNPQPFFRQRAKGSFEVGPRWPPSHEAPNGFPLGGSTGWSKPDGKKLRGVSRGISKEEGAPLFGRSVGGGNPRGSSPGKTPGQPFSGPAGPNPPQNPVRAISPSKGIWDTPETGPQVHPGPARGFKLFPPEWEADGKGGIPPPGYRCARGSTSPESFHLHLGRFIPGELVVPRYFQAFLVDGVVRGGTPGSCSGSGACGCSDTRTSLQSYSGPPQKTPPTRRGQKGGLGHRKVEDFTKPVPFKKEEIPKVPDGHQENQHVPKLAPKVGEVRSPKGSAAQGRPDTPPWQACQSEGQTENWGPPLSRFKGKGRGQSFKGAMFVGPKGFPRRQKGVGEDRLGKGSALVPAPAVAQEPPLPAKRGFPFGFGWGKGSPLPKKPPPRSSKGPGPQKSGLFPPPPPPPPLHP